MKFTMRIGTTIRLKGVDGVFAREIYLYLLKFEELQKEIVQWRIPEQHLRYLD